MIVKTAQLKKTHFSDHYRSHSTNRLVTAIFNDYIKSFIISIKNTNIV